MAVKRKRPAAKRPGSSQASEARLAQVNECQKTLRERFESVFATETLPLKVGIKQDILTALGTKFSKKVVELAVGRHVRQEGYLRSLKAGRPRYGLGGQEDGRVTLGEEQQANAALDALMRARSGWSEPAQVRSNLQLLKRFEASGRSAESFADQVGLAKEDLVARLRRAEEARTEKRRQAEELVSRWRASGSSMRGFCKKEGIKLEKLEQAVKRASGEDGAEQERGSRPR